MLCVCVCVGAFRWCIYVSLMRTAEVIDGRRCDEGRRIYKIFLRYINSIICASATDICIRSKMNWRTRMLYIAITRRNTHSVFGALVSTRVLIYDNYIYAFGLVYSFRRIMRMLEAWGEMWFLRGCAGPGGGRLAGKWFKSIEYIVTLI